MQFGIRFMLGFFSHKFFQFCKSLAMRISGNKALFLHTRFLLREWFIETNFNLKNITCLYGQVAHENRACIRDYNKRRASVIHAASLVIYERKRFCNIDCCCCGRQVVIDEEDEEVTTIRRPVLPDVTA